MIGSSKWFKIVEYKAEYAIQKCINFSSLTKLGTHKCIYHRLLNFRASLLTYGYFCDILLAWQSLFCGDDLKKNGIQEVSECHVVVLMPFIFFSQVKREFIFMVH